MAYLVSKFFISVADMVPVLDGLNRAQSPPSLSVSLVAAVQSFFWMAAMIRVQESSMALALVALIPGSRLVGDVGSGTRVRRPVNRVGLGWAGGVCVLGRRPKRLHPAAESIMAKEKTSVERALFAWNHSFIPFLHLRRSSLVPRFTLSGERRFKCRISQGAAVGRGYAAIPV